MAKLDGLLDTVAVREVNRDDKEGKEIRFSRPKPRTRAESEIPRENVPVMRLSLLRTWVQGPGGRVGSRTGCPSFSGCQGSPGGWISDSGHHLGCSQHTAYFPGLFSFLVSVTFLRSEPESPRRPCTRTWGGKSGALRALPGGPAWRGGSGKRRAPVSHGLQMRWRWLPCPPWRHF